MIPPGAPHFGGLWEAAVKSAKTHMKKTMGKQIFSFEEMQTLLYDISSILNSRPLCSVSDDPNDLDALTPQMLLTGKRTTVLALPNPDPLSSLKQMEMCPQKRWAHITNLAGLFWKRWSSEYIGTLQVRNKWQKETKPIKEGDIVLVTDEQTAPMHWPLGIIEKTFAGEDDIVRAVLVRTQKASYKRSVHKLRRLPFDSGLGLPPPEVDKE